MDAVLTEETKTWEGTWTTEWRCEPPAMSEKFIVTHDEWSDDDTRRTIYSWEPVS